MGVGNAGAVLIVLTLIISALFVTGPFGAQLFSQVSGLTCLGH